MNNYNYNNNNNNNFNNGLLLLLLLLSDAVEKDSKTDIIYYTRRLMNLNTIL